MTRNEPKDGQFVEVFIEGKWHKAKFHHGDFIAPDDPEMDELWWHEYFSLENGDTFPEDIHKGISDFPPWKPL